MYTHVSRVPASSAGRLCDPRRVADEATNPANEKSVEPFSLYYFETISGHHQDVSCMNDPRIFKLICCCNINPPVSVTVFFDGDMPQIIAGHDRI